MWCSFTRGGDSSVCCLNKGYLKMVFQVAFVMADRAKGLMKHLTSVPLRFQVAFYTFSFKASQVMSDMQLAKGYLKKRKHLFSGSLYLAYAPAN